MKSWYYYPTTISICIIILITLAIVMPLGLIDHFSSVQTITIPIEQAVVKVKNSTGHGSGFIVDSSGIIVTAAHVMAHNPDTVVLSDGTIYPIKAEMYINQELDIAVIKIDATKVLPTIILVPSDQYGIGIGVTICGYPREEKYRQSYGYIAGRRNRHEVQLDVDGNSGNSGGPILVGRNCIGMITRGEYNSDITRGTCSEVIQTCVDIYKILYGSKF